MNKFLLPLGIAVMAIICGLHAQDTANVIPFQGQLANQAGQTLSSTNAVTLVFRLYQVPVGGVAIWEESQPNISVNAGRFSVLLGSRTLLPVPTYFNNTLYLGITVDDGNPATADVELRPRQALVPVVSASYAKNAGKLNGYDWSALFGTNNPVDGSLLPSKIGSNSITGAQIAFGTITSNQIAAGTITANQIAIGGITQGAIGTGAVGSQQLAGSAVGPQQIAAAGILTSNLADGVVTLPKLAAITIGSNVGVGGLGLSATVDGFTSSANTYIDIPGLSVTNATVGRPVLLALITGDTTNGACFIEIDGNGTINAQINLRFLVNGVPMPALIALDGGSIRVPSSSFQTLCFPSAGTNRFSVQIACGTAGNSLIVRGTRLIAKEL